MSRIRRERAFDARMTWPLRVRTPLMRLSNWNFTALPPRRAAAAAVAARHMINRRNFRVGLRALSNKRQRRRREAGY